MLPRCVSFTNSHPILKAESIHPPHFAITV
jgi:hypothetical protein